MTNVEQTPMLTVFDVAKRMNISERTVFRWIKTGKLKSVRVGRVVRVTPDDLNRFVQMHKSGHRASNHQRR